MAKGKGKAKDGEINIQTKINTDDIEKGLNDLKNKLSKATGTNVVKGVVGLGAAFAGVSMAVKGATAAIKATTEVYRTQKKAETQLEAAAKNNPYLDARSVKQLKSYASELQSIGTIGDEEILPLMAQLASAGRTQEEIQRIMAASLDVSASGAMSLESAVRNLNKTYSGLSGELGESIPQIKNLTAEELKQGKAVDVIAAQYKNMAAETTKATGTSEQLANAWGDLKEEIGASFEKPLSSVRRFFTELISGWTDAAKARREYNEAAEAVENGTGTSNDYNEVLRQRKKEFSEISRQMAEVQELINNPDKLAAKTQQSRGYYTKATAEQQLKGLKEKYNALNKEIESLINGYNNVAKAEQEATKAAEENVKAQEKAAAAAARNQSAADLKTQNAAALEQRLKQMELEAQLNGKQIDQREKLNVLISSYIDLVTTDNKLVTENNEYAKERLKQLKEFAAGIKETTIDYDDLIKKINDFLDVSGEEKLSDTIDTTILSLQAEQDALKDNAYAWEQYTKKIEELQKLKNDVIEKENAKALQLTKDNAAEITAEIANYITQFGDIVGQVTDLMKESSAAETETALAQLDEQYTDGLISYEDYCEKKKEISRDAAYDEYKINMWTWTASLLQATANIAQGVAKAIAEGGAAGIITGALVSAAGAASIASIVAAKPQRPSFFGGGFVGGMHGATIGGDNTTANLRNGELVLNAVQQAQLWRVANGGGNGGNMKLAVNVVNNMGDSAKVSTQLDAQGLRVTIDKLVNSSMKEGRYNESLSLVESSKKGVSYL